MKFIETPLADAWQIELARMEDERGFFARSFCEREFADHGLPARFVQCNVSFNRHAGTIRGMHWQLAPVAEAKLVRCTAGALFDVIVDLRPSSTTYLRSFGIELTSENRTMLLVPAGFAHGFQTLRDATEVFYQMSDFHAPGAARGFRWNDPRIGIAWPREASVISQRDRELPLFEEIE